MEIHGFPLENDLHMVDFHGENPYLCVCWRVMGHSRHSYGISKLLPCSSSSCVRDRRSDTETMISSSTLWTVSTINGQWASSVSSGKASHGRFP